MVHDGTPLAGHVPGRRPGGQRGVEMFRSWWVMLREGGLPRQLGHGQAWYGYAAPVTRDHLSRAVILITRNLQVAFRMEEEYGVLSV